MGIPAFYDDLNLSFLKAWDLIEPGAAKRTSPAHTPAVATVDEHGQPQLRIMVLRGANRNTRRLRFHTDLRSGKIIEIGHRTCASVLMYDPLEKLQLRLAGNISLASEGSDVDNAWQQSTTFARRCYLAEASPGTVSEKPTSGLPNWIEGKQPGEEDLVEARANFALLWFEADSIEFLYLANAGHRRAKWDWDERTGSWLGRWLVP